MKSKQETEDTVTVTICPFFTKFLSDSVFYFKALANEIMRPCNMLHLYVMQKALQLPFFFLFFFFRYSVFASDSCDQYRTYFLGDISKLLCLDSEICAGEHDMLCSGGK